MAAATRSDQKDCVDKPTFESGAMPILKEWYSFSFAHWNRWMKMASIMPLGASG